MSSSPDPDKFFLDLCARMGLRLLYDVAPSLARIFDRAVLQMSARVPRPSTTELLPGLSDPSYEGDTLIGILTPGVYDQWETPVLDEVYRRLSPHGFRFKRAHFLESPFLFARAFSMLASLRPTAILLMPPPSGYVSSAFCRTVRDVGIPVVALDRELGPSFPCVEPDHQYGNALGVREALKHKPSTIVQVMGNERIEALASRARGFEEATASKHGLRVVKFRLGEPDYPTGQFRCGSRLQTLISHLSVRDGIAFCVDNSGGAVEVHRRVLGDKGYWPDRWILQHFDGPDESNLKTCNAPVLGPTMVIGSRVDKMAIAGEAASLIELIRKGTSPTGPPIRVAPSLQVV